MRTSIFNSGVLGKALIGVSFLIGLNCGVFAQTPEMVALQRRVEAGFLYKFAQLTEWPTNIFASTNSPIVLGVVGPDPFGSVLDSALTNRQVAGRAIELRRFKHDDDIRNCHLLFVGASDDARLSAIIAKLEGRSVLTVSEMPGFAEQGGMIQFVPAPKGNLVFKINVAAATSAGLKLSSHLLKLHLAEIVGPKPTALRD